MPKWSMNDLHTQMRVFSSDKTDIGHVAHIYEDSFLIHQGVLFPTDRYIPYSAITAIDHEHIYLAMSAAEVKEMKWEKRPDYEDHLGDPTQLMYDRGHGVSDPFDSNSPNKG